jgi:NCS1 family nucleobase:cation symporter-1
VAMVALVLAILPNLPGFLAQIIPSMNESVPNFFKQLYHYAWFVGFILAFLFYLVGKQFTVEGQKVNATETAKIPADKI